MKEFEIGNRKIGRRHPALIIAEIGSNFDGSLRKAKKLIDLAAVSGADSVKFQSFIAEKIICAAHFKKKQDFQSKWKKSVFEVYKEAELPRQWHRKLLEHCNQKKVIFLSAPYDYEAVDLLEKVGVSAFKIGSGEITNTEFLGYVASKKKPILLATGACTFMEVKEAVRTIRRNGNKKLALLQCTTNYPARFENANLLGMKTLEREFRLPVGYSDHCPGDILPIASIALGGKIIEKHFTDDRSGQGPDHDFAMDPESFSSMVKKIRNLEKAFGDGRIKVEPSEKTTKILQRRSIFASRDIGKGERFSRQNLTVLRPEKGILPNYLPKILGRKAKRKIRKWTPITKRLVGL
jgi:N-acetylneuraminate synthase